MRAWSTIVARGPCLMVNLSAGVASGRCPIHNIFAGAASISTSKEGPTVLHLLTPLGPPREAFVLQTLS